MASWPQMLDGRSKPTPAVILGESFRNCALSNDHSFRSLQVLYVIRKKLMSCRIILFVKEKRLKYYKRKYAKYPHVEVSGESSHSHRVAGEPDLSRHRAHSQP